MSEILREADDLAPLESGQAAPRAHRRIGVMGGTFDPIHHGHLVAASEVAARFDLDEVVFVPTGQPWQKIEVSLAEHRYLMAVIATAANPRFTVSRVDIERPGPTYTKDTLTDLRRAEPDAEWFFITGADALEAIMSWKDVGEVFGLAHFVGVTRPGFQLSDTQLPRGSVTLIEVPAMAISSTDCRRRVREGAPVWYLVPDGVVQYIGKHRLYLEAPSGPAAEPSAGRAAPGPDARRFGPDADGAGGAGGPGSAALRSGADRDGDPRPPDGPARGGTGEADRRRGNHQDDEISQPTQHSGRGSS